MHLLSFRLTTSSRRLAAGAAVAAALAGFMPAAWSAQPTTASIEVLLIVTKSEALVDKTGADLERNMQGAVLAGLQGRQPTAREQQAIDRMTRETAAVIRQEMSWAQMRPMMIKIYQDTFTQEEVDGQIAFYRSPVGAAVVDKMPLVMQATMAATQQSLARVMPQLQAIVKKTIEDTKAAAAAEKKAP